MSRKASRVLFPLGFVGAPLQRGPARRDQLLPIRQAMANQGRQERAWLLLGRRSLEARCWDSAHPDLPPARQASKAHPPLRPPPPKHPGSTSVVKSTQCSAAYGQRARAQAEQQSPPPPARPVTSLAGRVETNGLLTPRLVKVAGTQPAREDTIHGSTTWQTSKPYCLHRPEAACIADVG